MGANKKLSALLAGRTVDNTSTAGKEMRIKFADDSQLIIQLGEGTEEPPFHGDVVEGIVQNGIIFTLNMVDGRSRRILLEDACSSVMLRNKNNQVEYTD